jgi:magnesium transporter
MDITKGKITWYDFTAPSKHDIAFLKKEYKFHPMILEELTIPSSRTHVESYDDHLYIVYQFPVYDPYEKVSQRSEVDILVTKNAVYTIHYEDLEPLQLFRAQFNNEHFKARAMKSTLSFVHALFETFQTFNERQLLHIHEKVEHIGFMLFKEKEMELLKEISYIKRDLSQYRVIISPQEQLLHAMLEHGQDFWGQPSRVYLNDLMGNFRKIMNRIEDYRQAVIDFEDTNRQLMDIKTNQIMKRFTALSFLTFPFVLTVAVVSMNTVDNPFHESGWGFRATVALVFIGIFTLFSYFKKKQWL